MDTVLKYMENNTAYLDQEYIYEPWHIYIYLLNYHTGTFRSLCKCVVVPLLRE